jgi:hypothetical protein
MPFYLLKFERLREGLNYISNVFTFGIKFQGNNKSVYRISQQFNMLNCYNTLK